MFKTFPGLTQYHHFTFYQDGSVTTRLYADSELNSAFLTRNDVTYEQALIIEDIIPEQLTAERQWYLYENIRQFVIKDSKKDLVAPKPIAWKPRVKCTGEESVDEKPSSSGLTNSWTKSSAKNPPKKALQLLHTAPLLKLTRSKIESPTKKQRKNATSSTEGTSKLVLVVNKPDLLLPK